MPKRSNKNDNLRGLNKSGSHVVKIDTVLNQVMSQYGYNRQLENDKLETAWAAAAGETFNKVTRPGKKRRGCLEVYVSHNVYLQEMMFRVDELLAALQQSLPDEGITSLKFIVKVF
ncbi:MAG: DUF721 domain-containing protein [Planctomycetaceae bacterium]|jgi:predicted nucleic acid-binding Zn ribbon protein|nr:DUF721 domain-containing protein [Planctomycetaceae bacterium]